MRGKAQNLGERLSRTESTESVDFEITFAALLATASLTYPLSQYPAASHAAAFAILILTLTRRMALLSEFIAEGDGESRREWFMAWTIPFLEFASVSAILMLLFRLYSEIPSEFANIAIFWFMVVLCVVLLAAIQELVFRDELIWWYHKIVSRIDEEKEDRSKVLGFMARKTWNWSQSPIADHGRGRFHYGPDSDESFTFIETFKIFVKGMGLYILVNAVLFAFGYALYGFSGVIFVFVIGIIRDQIRFWYSAYGNSSFDQISGPWYRTYLMVLIYLVAFSILL